LLPMKTSGIRQVWGTLSLALAGDEDDDWYIAFSRDDKHCAEGSWGDWVDLAKIILATDRQR